MRPRTSRSVKLRAFVAAVCSLAFLSGLAVVSMQGRAGWDWLSITFIVASGIALVIMLHAVSVIAQRTLGGSYTPIKSTRARDEDETENSSGHTG